jgi:hypothetical protein
MISLLDHNPMTIIAMALGSTVGFRDLRDDFRGPKASHSAKSLLVDAMFTRSHRLRLFSSHSTSFNLPKFILVMFPVICTVSVDAEVRVKLQT